MPQLRTPKRRALLLCILAALVVNPTRRGAGLRTSSPPWFPAASAIPVGARSNGGHAALHPRSSALPHSGSGIFGGGGSGGQSREAAPEENEDASGLSRALKPQASEAEAVESRASHPHSSGVESPALPETATSGGEGGSGGGSERKGRRPKNGRKDCARAGGGSDSTCAIPAAVQPRRVALSAAAPSAKACADSCR